MNTAKGGNKLLISKHFTLEQLTFSKTAEEKKVDNRPTPYQSSNLAFLAKEVLDLIQDHFQPKKLSIESGFRSVKVNKLVGGSENSDHMIGCAADISAAGLTPKQLYEELDKCEGLIYNQLILEYKKDDRGRYREHGLHISRIQGGKEVNRMDKRVLYYK